MRATDTTGLTPEQRAKLAYALTMIRSRQTLRKWTQDRTPDTGTPHTIRLLRRDKKGKLQEVYTVCEWDAGTRQHT